MHVLVTGHLGYVGVIMSRVLRDAGHTVVGLDTGYYDDCDLSPMTLEVPAIKRDIRDVSDVDLAGFDGIVHLAALSNDPLGHLNPELTYDINLHATLRLAQLAKRAGVARFVFASSCSLYGASGTDEALDETAPTAPLTPYAKSKIDSETELMALASNDFSPSLAVPRVTSRPRGSGPTSWSTIWSAGRSSPGKSACRAMDAPGGRSCMLRT
jgi:nucleoside-diphosphate-sugar epimerase